MTSNNESKIEKNLKLIAEHLKSLSKISYEEIVDMLSDEENHYQIEFYDKVDILNDLHYICVSILKNNNTSTGKEYLSADQDIKDVYTNLITALKEKEVESIFQIFTNYSGHNQLACNVGKNVLMFPKEIVDELMKSSSNSYRDDDILCVVGNKELFFPSSLTDKTKKNILRIISLQEDFYTKKQIYMECNDLIKFLKSAMNFDEKQIWYLKQQAQGFELKLDDMLEKFFELKTNEDIIKLYDYIQPMHFGYSKEQILKNYGRDESLTSIPTERDSDEPTLSQLLNTSKNLNEQDTEYVKKLLRTKVNS